MYGSIMDLSVIISYSGWQNIIIKNLGSRTELPGLNLADL